MKVKKCSSCGQLFAGNTAKCSDYINREEERAKDMAQIILFLAMAVAGLFWRLPKFIHKKAGTNGVIAYFGVLIALCIAGYFYYNGQFNKTIPGKSSPSLTAKELAIPQESGTQTQTAQELRESSLAIQTDDDEILLLDGYESSAADTLEPLPAKTRGQHGNGQ
jgi:hypothetical protein